MSPAAHGPQLKAEAAIARWQKAYEQANGKPAPVVTYHGHGWYVVEGREKLRARHFKEFAKRLERRVAEGKPT